MFTALKYDLTICCKHKLNKYFLYTAFLPNSSFGLQMSSKVCLFCNINCTWLVIIILFPNAKTYREFLSESDLNLWICQSLCSLPVFCLMFQSNASWLWLESSGSLGILTVNLSSVFCHHLIVKFDDAPGWDPEVFRQALSFKLYTLSHWLTTPYIHPMSMKFTPGEYVWVDVAIEHIEGQDLWPTVCCRQPQGIRKRFWLQILRALRAPLCYCCAAEMVPCFWRGLYFWRPATVNSGRSFIQCVSSFRL